MLSLTYPRAQEYLLLDALCYCRGYCQEFSNWDGHHLFCQDSVGNFIFYSRVIFGQGFFQIGILGPRMREVCLIDAEGGLINFFQLSIGGGDFLFGPSWQSHPLLA